MTSCSKSPGDSSAALGFEAKLWLAADSRGCNFHRNLPGDDVLANGSMSSGQGGIRLTLDPRNNSDRC